MRRFIHDTPCEFLIHHVTGMIHHVTIKKYQVTGKMHFFDFLIKVDLINFNLIAKVTIKKNLVIEVTKGPENLQ